MSRCQLQPYPGLRPFERHESKVFFGRQQQVDELLQRLKKQKFLVVLGASGSGKSSLVRAGLLSGLEKGYMGEIGARWRIAELRPGDAPFERLGESLREIHPVTPFAKEGGLQQSTVAIEGSPTLKKGEQGGFSSQHFLAAQLRRGSRSLHTLLEQSPLEDGEKLLILVDQFEEIFRYRQQAGNQAAAFVALLLEACTHPDIFVVITMRSDFLGDAAAFHGLPEAINDGLYLTPRLTREQLQQAIAYPARLFGGGVDEALVNQLVNEAGNNPDQLPLLQHALMRLWVEGEDKQLTLEEYRALDGLRGALNGHLEQVFKDLSPEQQRIAEVLFRALTERSAEGQATRRPATVAEVLAVADCSLNELTAVVDAFRGAGRHFLMTSTPELAGETVLDISHESLIRQWRRLQHWVEDEATKVETYRRLVDASGRYANSEGELWRGTDLALGLDWRREMQPDSVWAARYNSHNEQEFDGALIFLAESEQAEIHEQEAEEERRKRDLSRTQRQLGMAIVGLLIAAGLAIWGAVERSRAEQQKEVAIQEAERADRQAEMAKTEAERAERQKELAEQEAKRADEESERAKASEETRTQELFDSDVTHASLLALTENYASAKEKLKKTRSLDDVVPIERQHARDLLVGFTDIVSGNEQKTFTEQNGRPLSQLNGSVDVSPNGLWLAASGESGTIALFERESGKLVQKLMGHDVVGRSNETTVRDIVFHPEQPWLFSAGDDKKILWWQLPKETEKAILLGGWSVDAGSVYALALTPDGDVLASGHEDGSVRLWDINFTNPDLLYKKEMLTIKHEPIRILRSHSKMIAAGGLAFSPLGGRWLASASFDNSVGLWDWQNGESKHVLRGHTHFAQDVSFSPNGKVLASSSTDKSIVLWDVESGQILRRLRGHKNTVYSLKFLEDNQLASTSTDMTVRLWDVETGVTRRIFQGHKATVGGVVSYTRAGETLLYSSGNDGVVKQWQGNLPKQWLVELYKEASAVVISPTGKIAAVAYANGDIELYDLEYQKFLDKIKGAHSFDVNRLAFNSDGTLLASVGGISTKLWQVADGKLKELETFSDHKNIVHAVTFSQDSTQLATASYDGYIGLFDLQNRKRFLFKAHDGYVESVSFDPSGKKLLSSGYNDFKLKLWDLSAKSPAATTIGVADDAILWASLSPDGTQVASVGRGQSRVVIHSIKDNSILHLQGHEQTVFKAIFSPDSRQLATVSTDLTVRLWDLDTQSELFQLSLPAKRKNSKDVPLWDFDFRCTPTGCWIAVPLTSGKLALYNLGKIDYNKKD